jgi:hypothetical protein
MRKLIYGVLIASGLVLMLPATGSAKPKPKNGDAPRSVPEIDPGVAVTGLTLLSAGLLIIRSRRTGE